MNKPIVRFYVALCDADRGGPRVGSKRRDVAVDMPLGTPPEVIEREASKIERLPRDRVYVFGTYGGFESP